MIKVGFIGVLSKEWMGGVNYYKNLLFALASLKDKELEIFVFTGKNTDTEIKSMFSAYATVIENSLFDRGSIKWFLAKIEKICFNKSSFYAHFFKQYGIQILSHTSLTQVKDIRTINWIPDFQHMHLPEMFSIKEIEQRNQEIKKIMHESNLVILSSYDALKDCNQFACGYEPKVRVLQFVSQPGESYAELDKNDQKRLLDKYQLPESFFYIPNQFWKHKNHLFLFKVINELKREGLELCVVCSGHLDDYRNKHYIDDVKNFINSNQLHRNIRLLGLIDYEEVFALVKFSKAVINPSLFEGWSSTVEECKSLNKNMILSDLNVHMEQYPSATFFERNNFSSLKDVLRNYNKENSPIDIEPIEQRTYEFAQKYVNICNEVMCQ